MYNYKRSGVCYDDKQVTYCLFMNVLKLVFLCQKKIPNAWSLVYVYTITSTCTLILHKMTALLSSIIMPFEIPFYPSLLLHLERQTKKRKEKIYIEITQDIPLYTLHLRMYPCGTKQNDFFFFEIKVMQLYIYAGTDTLGSERIRFYPLIFGFFFINNNIFIYQ